MPAWRLLSRGRGGAYALFGGHVVGGKWSGVEHGVRAVRRGRARVRMRGGCDRPDANNLRARLLLRGRRSWADAVRPRDGMPAGGPRGAAGVLLDGDDTRGRDGRFG